jgi:hypothetical protein
MNYLTLSITLLALLALVACGGGGGSGSGSGSADTAAQVSTNATITPTSNNVVDAPQSSSCVVKPTVDTDKYRSAIMDMRFEQPNDFTADGKLVASFDAVNQVIDKIDCVGFNTIVFQTNIPIDVKTGNLELYDSSPVAYNRDKNIPKDFWRLVKYSKDRGLRVFIKAIPVNHINDEIICPGCTWIHRCRSSSTTDHRHV